MGSPFWLPVSAAAMCILVPPNFLAFLSASLGIGWTLAPRSTLMSVLGYLGWMACTDRFKRYPGHFGPEWFCSLLATVLKGALDGLGCSRKIIMEFVNDPKSDQRYVACYNPHGAYATAGICYAMSEFRLHPHLKLLNGNLVGASVLFYVP